MRLAAALRVAVWLAVLAAGMPALGSAQAEDPGLPDLFVVLLRHRLAWTAVVTPANQALQQAHASYLMQLGQTGALLMAGPLAAHPTAEEIRGLVILRAKAYSDVVELFARDPKVKAGFLVADVLAWQVPTFMARRLADAAIPITACHPERSEGTIP